MKFTLNFALHSLHSFLDLNKTPENLIHSEEEEKSRSMFYEISDVKLVLYLKIEFDPNEIAFHLILMSARIFICRGKISWINMFNWSHIKL